MAPSCMHGIASCIPTARECTERRKTSAHPYPQQPALGSCSVKAEDADLFPRVLNVILDPICYLVCEEGDSAKRFLHCGPCLNGLALQPWKDQEEES